MAAKKKQILGKSFQQKLLDMQAARPKKRCDGHCPLCGADIGGHGEYDLEELFDGRRYNSGLNFKQKWICPNPECMEPILVEMHVSFSIEEL